MCPKVPRESLVLKCVQSFVTNKQTNKRTKTKTKQKTFEITINKNKRWNRLLTEWFNCIPGHLESFGQGIAFIALSIFSE